ncbi:acetyltransferase, GNAT family protein [Marinomonas sp. MED121]|uniref:GNAT family N-acetyltransferase n=1 Tax=Marinomonas sp. MED121 TaxID=314277 RepID=UPI00006909E1|nr:GNAT family N-acetyltransferase [Marinomonas sp. MED121]EAQ64034.1 acetyltransferase, GNAT family protein [Marinomonas sp. MED121]
MDIEVLEQPDQSLIDFLSHKIREFNWENWEVSERLPLAVQVKDDDGNLIAGAGARTFGDWLLLDTLWVSETLRGQDVGSKILQAVEEAGRARGCKKCMLETLNFQAKPFYEKFGYQVVWTQENYPKTGCQYFMVKQL